MRETPSTGPTIQEILRRLSLPTALVLLAGLLVALLARAAAPVTSSDTYFHLRLGDEFRTGWAPWAPESVTRYATADWVPTQWLGQVVMSLTNDAFGLPGIAWMTGLWIVFYAGVLFLTTRMRVGPLLAVLITIAAIVGSFPALSGRPQVLSYAFVALSISAWLTAYKTKRVPWWLIGLSWLWATCHGMWIIGIAIAAVAVFGILVDDPRQWRRAHAWASVPILSAVAAALTPVGPALYTGVFRVNSISNYFIEWGPPDLTDRSTAASALLVSVLVLLKFRAPENSWFSIALTLLCCVWLGWNSRTVPIAAAMGAVLLADQMANVLRRPLASRFERWATPALFSGALLALAFLVPHTAAAPAFAGNAAHASVHALPPGTGLLNEWNKGGTDMWLHPHLDVVMHGYGDMFTNDELDRNYSLGSLDPGWQEAIAELKVSDALLLVDERLAAALRDTLHWEVIAEDGGLVHLRSPDTIAEQDKTAP